ncbi:hypothetical protein MBLNU457_2377t1 [Dothideomycetes sp. NU457]
MKQRFSSLDVKIIAHELAASLVSLRVSNVYDLSTRIFLLKFAKPEHKEQLLIDSGFRCHLTSFSRTTAAAPSPFVARLRKFLKTRRVTAVSQVGTDRIIDIQFSDGQYRLFLEFYAGGNIVLTDSELTILALLRNVNEGEEHEQYRVGLKYNLDLRQNYGGIPPLTKERVREGLQKVIQKQGQDGGQGKKIKKKQGDALRKALAVTINEYPPILLDHALQTAGFDKETQPSEVVENDELLEKLMGVFDEAAKVMADITSRDTAKGYIIAKTSGKEQGPPSDGQTDADSQRAGVMYDDFHPFKPVQLEGKPDTTFLEFEGFNKTVDEFFSSIEGQRLESKLQEREDNAKKRLEQARTEHEKRIGGLQQVQELNVQKAEAIEANLDRVEEATAAVNGLIAQGMDWVEIGRLIEMEQKKHNLVAEMIKLPLKLHENTVTLKLSGWTADEEDDEMADETDSEASDSDEEQTPAKQKPVEDKRLAVDIDLSLSPWSNARQYYDQRKTAAIKQDKTQQASAKALKSTEQRITSDLKKGLKQEKAVLRPVRQQLWFEKFIYFISSDGYLIIGSKDAQQSEVIYRRHLKKGDIYVHADLPGAAPVIIKNNTATPDAPIPPTTLSQAGNLCVCTSNAWDSKAVMSAWWVNAEEVSKTAPTGEYLATGNFTIKGKKNYLPPAQLLLGFAVMFQISEESKAQHMKHRLKDEPSDTPHEVTTSAPAEKARTEAQDDDDADDGNEEDGTADEDDEFPDVKAAATDEDDDDDFPDAKDEHTDEEHHEDHKPRSNPLQNGQSTARDEEESSDDEDEDVAEAPGSGATSTVDEDEHASGSTSGVRHLSAKERRQLKKGNPSTTDEPSDKETKPVAATTKAAQTASAPKPNLPTRGKRAKAKRQAQKYADQDDEDRALAMSLLGSRKAEAPTPSTDTKTETASEARERRRQQHEKTQRLGLEAEERRRAQLEADTAADDDEDDNATHTISLDQFVGLPLPGDEILEAIPVCAPWSALGRYKYKAKLQPGAQKKGKAVREILTRWGKGFAESKFIDEKSMDKERIWPREAELVRAWKETEVLGVVPVKTMRVMMAGGSGGGGGDKSKGKKGRGGRGSKKK